MPTRTEIGHITLRIRQVRSKIRVREKKTYRVSVSNAGIPDIWITAKNEESARRVLTNWLYNALEEQGELEDEDVLEVVT